MSELAHQEMLKTKREASVLTWPQTSESGRVPMVHCILQMKRLYSKKRDNF